jgi:hypothetical protein
MQIKVLGLDAADGCAYRGIGRSMMGREFDRGYLYAVATLARLHPGEPQIVADLLGDLSIRSVTDLRLVASGVGLEDMETNRILEVSRSEMKHRAARRTRQAAPRRVNQ